LKEAKVRGLSRHVVRDNCRHCLRLKRSSELVAGASLSRVWSLVGSIISKKTAVKFSRHLGKDIEPTVDESYQRFLWPYIVSYPGIEFGAVIANDNPTLVEMELEEYKEYDTASIRKDLRLTAKAQLRLRILLAPLPVRSESDQFVLLVDNILIIL
jgi:hypothetical protein